MNNIKSFRTQFINCSENNLHGTGEFLYFEDYPEYLPMFPNNKMLEAIKDGSFKGILELETGNEFQFKYLVDGMNWINDTEADSFVASPYGEANSIVSTIA